MFKEINNFKDLLEFMKCDCDFFRYSCNMIEYMNKDFKFYIDESPSNMDLCYNGNSRFKDGYEISKVNHSEKLEKERIKVSGFGPWAKYTEEETMVSCRTLDKILFIDKNGRFEIFNEKLAHEFVLYCKEIINNFNKAEENRSIQQNEIFNSKKVMEEKIFS